MEMKSIIKNNVIAINIALIINFKKIMRFMQPLENNPRKMQREKLIKNNNKSNFQHLEDKKLIFSPLSHFERLQDFKLDRIYSNEPKIFHNTYFQNSLDLKIRQIRDISCCSYTNNKSDTNYSFSSLSLNLKDFCEFFTLFVNNFKIFLFVVLILTCFLGTSLHYVLQCPTLINLDRLYIIEVS